MNLSYWQDKDFVRAFGDDGGGGNRSFPIPLLCLLEDCNSSTEWNYYTLVARYVLPCLPAFDRMQSLDLQSRYACAHVCNLRIKITNSPSPEGRKGGKGVRRKILKKKP